MPAIRLHGPHVEHNIHAAVRATDDDVVRAAHRLEKHLATAAVCFRYLPDAVAIFERFRRRMRDEIGQAVGGDQVERDQQGDNLRRPSQPAYAPACHAVAFRHGVDDERALRAERVDEGRRDVRDELEVRLVDRLEAADRRAVEQLAHGEEVLVDRRGRDVEVLLHAREVGEADVEELDLGLLDELEDFRRITEHVDDSPRGREVRNLRS